MYKTLITYLLNEWFAINTLGLSSHKDPELLRDRAHVSFISVPYSLTQGLTPSGQAIRAQCHAVQFY